MKKDLFIPALFALCFFLLTQATGYSQDGTLDPTFDGDGIAITPIGSNYDNINAIALQPDGKIVAGGFYSGPTDDFVLVRYNVDGSLDNTFGASGIVTTDFSATIERVISIGIQEDGKIVAAGFIYFVGMYYFAVARYNPDGSLDPTFDTDGKVMTAVGTYASIGSSMTLQPDGKIIVVGVADDGTMLINDFAVVRYNSDGSLDNSFSTDGMLTTQINLGQEVPLDVVLQDDGKILVTGNSWNGTTNDFAIVRYNSDGTLDPTFDTDGILVSSVNPDGGVPVSLAVQPDGKIIAAGSSGTAPSDNDFTLARYNAEGSIDHSFGDDGIVISEINMTASGIRSIVLQPDGKIVAGGFSGVYPETNYTLARYQTNGEIDSTFGINGVVTTVIGAASNIYEIILQDDGKIIAGGYSDDGSGYTDFTVARYITDSEITIIDEASSKTQILIYPNPVRDRLMFRLPDNLKDSKDVIVNIYSADGKWRGKAHLTETALELNVHDWPAGFYTIKGSDGVSIYSSDFIIQK